MRIAYQFHHLNEEAQKLAATNNAGKLLTQFLYNVDGSNFKCSTTVIPTYDRRWYRLSNPPARKIL
jgi:hypothetical protein